MTACHPRRGPSRPSRTRPDARFHRDADVDEVAVELTAERLGEVAARACRQHDVIGLVLVRLGGHDEAVAGRPTAVTSSP